MKGDGRGYLVRQGREDGGAKVKEERERQNERRNVRRE